MGERIERRREYLRDTWVSAVSIFVAVNLAFPPFDRFDYWPSYPDYFQFGPIEIGNTGILVLMAVLSVVLGGAIAILEDIGLPGFISGGVIAYITGMVAIESFYSPSDSPVHFLFYGAILVCFTIGAALATSILRGKLLQRAFDKLFATSRS